MEETKFTYSADEGVLAVTHFNRLIAQIEIGPSYNARYLKLVGSSSGTRIVYGLADPNSPPAVCSCEPIFSKEPV
ncbi:hypothetical protein METBIDRAFT_30481 [Metschnikowia bicuspidata var. bicuspidata NRRL YB-4993]|uniref:Uncharacterized protein n=1 Tax=Metschnikowia bicuspidata var. bicuspidata NRRL YB-4993 TaxID=869754 RepID=A0A1A0HJ15_9ASCO|nr:hypothetical protein METBIDRAFT_30481 [Metschnikowia bicuspidata var. bicuspidata NRRL YB-4993]OBA24149.1 hypothetical protein METBIDRAFT_30481 [Metschnikowia bicuspidata var. bicuspidata NRRL YB-4993]